MGILVGGLEHDFFMTFHILGMSSSQLTFILIIMIIYDNIITSVCWLVGYEISGKSGLGLGFVKYPPSTCWSVMLDHGDRE